MNASTGRYYTNGGNASFQNRRPIQPFTKLDVTQPGFVAHGALITSATSNDLADVDAAFSRVIEDRAAFSPELVGDATSPTRLQSIATFSAPTGRQQRLLISTGQYLADGVPDPQGIGTQRLFTALGGVVLYAPDSVTDFRAPTFGPVQAFAATPTTVGFAVDIDDSQGFGSVKRVLVLYKDGTGVWRSIELSHAAASKRWSGGGLFSGSAAEWFIQAVDQNGNVGVISNKASIDPVTLPAPTGGISAVCRRRAPRHRGQRVVQGRRDRDDQRRSRYHLQPRRGAFRSELRRHRLRHRPAHGRVPGLQRRPRHVDRPDRRHCTEHRHVARHGGGGRDPEPGVLPLQRRRLRHRVVRRIGDQHVDADPERRDADLHRDGDRPGRADDDRNGHVPSHLRVPRLRQARRPAGPEHREGGDRCADQLQPRRKLRPEDLRGRVPADRADPVRRVGPVTDLQATAPTPTR